MSAVTQILSRVTQGDETAGEQLYEIVYEELKRLATAKMVREKPGQTLQATALVHEAFLKLTEGEGIVNWQNRGHFFGAAAEAMRRILVDRARRRDRLKRGGQHRQIVLEEQHLGFEIQQEAGDLLDLDAALDRLAEHDSRAMQVVKLRFFAGLTNQQIAEALSIATKTVQRDWAYARAWLGTDLGES